MIRLRPLLPLLGVIALLAAACGGDSDAAPAPAATQPAAAAAVAPAATVTVAPDASPTAAPAPAAEATAGPAQDTTSVPLYAWEVFTLDDIGAKPSLAVDPEGIPHVAYILEAMPGFVNYAVLNSGSWDISTVSTGYFYGPLDIQVDRQGVPQISWHNHDSEDQAYAALVGGEWLVQDIEHPGHDGWDGSLAIDSDGLPHTISIDPSQFGSLSGVEYAAFDGASWTVEEVGSGPVPYEFGTGIALDSDGRVHVVWFDGDDKDLMYAIRDTGTWEISRVDTEGSVGRFASLKLDKQGNPAISYYARMDRSSGYIKYARWDGGQWNIQRIDRLENVNMGHFGARKTSSLALDAEDSPVVAYSDESVIKLATLGPSGWNLETVYTAGELPLGQQVSMAMDAAGGLHLTFAEVAETGQGVNGPVKYVKGTRLSP